MLLDMMHFQNFYCQLVNGVKMLFVVWNSSSPHIDNRIKDILILGEALADAFDDTTITAELNILLISLKLEIIFFESTVQCSQQFFAC